MIVARRSLGAVLAAAMLTVALGAQAVLGVSVHNVTGKVGAWSALDDPGAKCIFYRLKKGSKQYRGFGYCTDRYGGTPSL